MMMTLKEDNQSVKLPLPELGGSKKSSSFYRYRVWSCSGTREPTAEGSRWPGRHHSPPEHTNEMIPDSWRNPSISVSSARSPKNQTLSGHSTFDVCKPLNDKEGGRFPLYLRSFHSRFWLPYYDTVPQGRPYRRDRCLIESEWKWKGCSPEVRKWKDRIVIS